MAAHADDPQLPPGPNKHCAGCGEVFAVSAPTCPHCHMAWRYRPPRSVGELTGYLDYITRAHEEGLLDDRSFAALREELEAPLFARRPARRAPRRPHVVAETAVRPSVQAGIRPPRRDDDAAESPPTPPPARPPRQSLGAWAAHRQADILLYLGAFLLSVAALIFVSYQGGSVPGGVKFGILVVYTVGFLLLGLFLGRWERVREAGPVFLGLGALLVPVDFIALRTEVLDQGEAGDNVLWLFGSATSAGLYTLLGVRGFGRYYFAPAAPAMLIAWGALAAVLGLPAQWFGAWFEGLAGAGWVAAAALDRRGVRGGNLARAAALVVGAPALLASHLGAGFSEDHHAQLPATYALLVVADAGSLMLGRTVVRFAALPAALAAFGAALAWAAAEPGPEWLVLFMAMAAAGYLVVAHFDAPRAIAWGWGAAAAGAGLLAFAASAQEPGLADQRALPVAVALALALALAVVAFARWRWAGAGLTIPALGSLTVSTTCWAWFDIDPAWYGALAAGSAFGYLALAHFEEDRFVPLRRAGALLATGLGLTLAHGAQAVDGAPHEALPAAYAVVTTAAAIAFARWRWQWPEMPALVPALAASLGAAATWAWADMPLEWLGAWAGGAALGYLALSIADTAAPGRWRRAALVAGVAAIAWAQAGAFYTAVERAELPVTYGLLLLGSAYEGFRRRDGGLFAPILGAALGASILWAVEAPPEWWAFPALGIAAVMAASSPVWRRASANVPLGWWHTLAMSAAPTIIALPLHATHTRLGLAAQLISAALIAAAVRLAPGSLGVARENRAVERVFLAHGALAFLFAAAASFNDVAGIGGPERAWIFVGGSAAAWLMLTALGRRWPTLLLACAPAGVAASAVAAVVAANAPGVATIALTAAALGPVVAFVAVRRWSLLTIAGVFAALAMWAGWRWQDANSLSLPLAYVVIAAFTWAALWRARTAVHPSSETSLVVDLLSWAPWALSGAVAAGILADANGSRAPGEPLVTAAEWAMASIVLAAGSSAVFAEGVRRRSRLTWLPPTFGLLASGLMAIATAEPSNVQAYSAVIGVYLLVIGFSWRTSGALFGPHMLQHEALMVAGVLFLVLPPTEQSFQTNGAKYGFELIALGVAFLALGLTLHARWLVPAGVLTLSGVAVRWLTGGYVEVPFWLLLGLLGTALLGIGVLVLVQRERWDRWKEATARWWIEPNPA